MFEWIAAIACDTLDLVAHGANVVALVVEVVVKGGVRLAGESSYISTEERE